MLQNCTYPGMTPCKETKSPRPTKKIRNILTKHCGEPVKLKQIYRHIYSVPYCPRRIAWGRGKAYSHIVISVKEAYNMLARVGRGENIQAQMNKLNFLSPTEKLVKRRAMKLYWIVNVASYPDIAGKVHYQKIATSLPLFYLNNDLQHTEVCFSKKAKRAEGCRRADQQVEVTPFLKSISVYRYKY